jgi:DNA polymerase-3 subunit alpha
LKAHYPAEFMAATLTHNMSDIKKLSFYMDECKHAGISVLGPDVNESWYKFAVNKQGAIRFGMGGIKGVGQGAVENIIDERKKNGNYKSIFDLTKRVDLRSVNKRVLEGLAYAGGFDAFTNTHRAQYFSIDEKGQSFVDKAIRFGNRFQESQSTSQMSLFGGESLQNTLPEPEIPQVEKWGIMEKLSKEKEVVGIYISGHPLDDFKHEMRLYCNTNLSFIKNPEENRMNRDLSVAGILTQAQHRTSKQGKGWASFTIEDYNETYEFKIFGEDYLKYRHFFSTNAFLYIRFKMQPGWREGDIQTYFLSFMMLQDVLQTLSKKITLHVEINQLNQKLIDELSYMIKKFKGTKELKFLVYLEDQIKLHMPSRKYKIAINNELLAYMESKNWMFEIK